MTTIIPRSLSFDGVTDFEGNLSDGVSTLLQGVHLPETANTADFLLPNNALEETLFDGLADVIENLALGLQVVASKRSGEHQLPIIEENDRR